MEATIPPLTAWRWNTKLSQPFLAFEISFIRKRR